jgi:ribosomal protein S18 acetylase RimI-like enzyme
MGGLILNILFRKATTSDVEGIIKLCNECFFENTSLEYAMKVFEKTKHDPNQIYLVGIVDNEIIAHAKITIIPTMYEEMNTYSIINHLCVKESCRRNNIATKMLNEISKICLEMNCKSIKLWSNNYRKAAHACYLKYGFLLNEAGFFSKEIA